MTQWVGDSLNSSCRRYAVLKRRQQECGSALIEFVILVPLLIMLLLVIADFGRVTSWAQQVAYSADAGAQYAYQRYSVDNVLDNIADIRTATTNAAPGLGLEDGEDGNVAVSGDWRCRLSVDDDGDRLISVRYSSSSVSQNYDCCKDTDEDWKKTPVLFIEVKVTDSFKPFSQFIEDVLPNNLTNFSVTSRRQIFPDELPTEVEDECP